MIKFHSQTQTYASLKKKKKPLILLTNLTFLFLYTSFRMQPFFFSLLTTLQRRLIFK